MRTLRAVLAPLVAAAMLGASPAPATVSAPASSAADTLSVASVAERFAGSWRCDGYARGDSGNEAYMREGTSVVSLVGALDSGALTSDRFSYDAARNVWQLTSSLGGGTFAAEPGASDRWVFVGTEEARRARRRARIVYTLLAPTAFRREHQIQVDNTWADDAEAVCRRTSAAVANLLPAPSPYPVRVTRPPTLYARSRDRAYHLVGGTWTCETIAGNAAPHTYTLARDGSIVLHTQFAIGKESVTVDERYRFDPAPNAWTETTDGNGYSATAAPWFGEKWTFEGLALVDGHPVPERMIYTDLDGRAFRRDFRQRRGATWATVASETCKRPS